MFKRLSFVAPTGNDIEPTLTHRASFAAPSINPKLLAAVPRMSLLVDKEMSKEKQKMPVRDDFPMSYYYTILKKKQHNRTAKEIG